MSEPVELASGLQFPEGPVVMPDGSIVVVELAAGAVSRIAGDGSRTLVAEPGGAPNGAALGPDGLLYICNNGGFYEFTDVEGIGLVPSKAAAPTGGRIQRIALDTGATETLYDQCDGTALVAPNDLVFDAHGGMWCTDHGVEGDANRPGVFYALADGSSIRGVVFGTFGTNGIGLSPRGDRLYVAETHDGRLWAWDVTGPGQIDEGSRTLLYETPDGHLFDSLAVDGEGWVCVATIINGGITAVSPDGATVEHHPVADAIVTNICFGGDDLRTAFVTASGTGKLVAMPWPRHGLRLAH